MKYKPTYDIKLGAYEFRTPAQALQEARAIDPENPPAVQKEDKEVIDKAGRVFIATVYKIIF